MASRSSTSSGGSIDLLTLAITAIASAAAAFTVSKIWPAGALASAAVTPVLVALFREGLLRPAKAVTQAVPVRGLVRSAPGPTGTQVHEAPQAPPLVPEAGPTLVPEPEPELAPAPAPTPAAPERVPQQGEVTYHSASRGRRWRLAIVTGLLGFVIAVVVFTVPELVSGQAASGDGATTLFGGNNGASTQPTQTTTVPGNTVTVPPPAQNFVPPPKQVVTAPTPTVTVTTPANSSTATTPQPAPAGPGSSAPAPAVPVPSSP
jgi:hypothetical protein